MQKMALFNKEKAPFFALLPNFYPFKESDLLCYKNSTMSNCAIIIRIKVVSG